MGTEVFKRGCVALGLAAGGQFTQQAPQNPAGERLRQPVDEAKNMQSPGLEWNTPIGIKKLTKCQVRSILSMEHTKMSRSEVLRSSLGFQVVRATDLIPKIEKGFSFAALKNFVSASGLSVPFTADVIGIPERTLARRRKENRLSSEESERLLRISRLFDDSLSLFDGDREAAVNWLRTPKKALRNQSPLQFARTEVGAREVENLIGRIEHGVFS